MSVRRVGWLAAMMFAMLMWLACGQVYRPVVIPCSTGGVPGCPVETPPTPANFHSILGISTTIPNYPGGAMQIDVSGDSIVGETPTFDPSKPNLGDNPTNLAILPNHSRVYAASAGSLLPGGLDVVSWFTPVFQSTLGTGLGTVGTIALPTGSEPVFLNTTQNTALFVANFGTNSVSSINTATNVLTNSTAVGANPVSIAEMPNALKLYVANQGSNTVSSLNAVDLSANTLTGFTGVTPVWVVARGDNQKVYVVSQGDGQLWTIDTATDTVTSSISVGAGANFIFYDPNLNRLYVTNPVTAMVYVFAATGGANDTPSQLAVIPFTAGSIACPTTTACTPASVTALLDGSRFYVASYQISAACPDPNLAGSGCVIPELTVFNANSLTLQYPTAPSLTLLTWPPFATNQYGVPPVGTCAPAGVYSPSPSSTRFRVFTVASVDSTRVYVSICDAGVVAVIDTTDSNTNNSGEPIQPDTLVADLAAPSELCTQASCITNAAITAFSITSNVVTFQATNAFVPGQSVQISGLTTGTYFDGLTLTVLATGLSGTQFECYFTSTNVGLTSDSGTAVPSSPTQTPIFLITGQ
jgi:YVTN family beta-propeller protein